ncbi:MAG TPA: hypothetical protein VIM80_02325 [Brevefilum sp.]
MNEGCRKCVLFITYLFFSLLLVSCSDSDVPYEPQPGDVVQVTSSGEEEDLWVRISEVQVSEKEAIFFYGQTNLPDQNCLYTSLYADDEILSWWPTGKCFPISGESWRFQVPLGMEGAPEELKPGVQYRLSVHWPGAPGSVTAEFPFDLSSPPSR